MTIRNNLRSDKRQAVSFFLMFVYLMVVNYSISHVHSPAENSHHLPWVWSEHESLCPHDSDKTWPSEQQHDHSCTLISQAPASLAGWQSPALGKELFKPVTRYLSLNLTTPTSRRTRAPPVFKA